MPPHPGPLQPVQGASPTTVRCIPQAASSTLLFQIAGTAHAGASPPQWHLSWASFWMRAFLHPTMKGEAPTSCWVHAAARLPPLHRPSMVVPRKCGTCCCWYMLQQDGACGTVTPFVRPCTLVCVAACTFQCRLVQLRSINGASRFAVKSLHLAL